MALPEVDTEERIAGLLARIEELEAVCMRDRFADGYAAGCEDFKRVGGKRIEALETLLQAPTKEEIALYARIEALEAALRFVLTDPPAALGEPDTDAEIIRHYREVARAALDKDAGE